MYTTRQKKKRLKKKKKMNRAHKHIIESIEHGKPISEEDVSSLTPSMKKFLDGIESGSRTGSTIHFSDFKSVPNKKKKNKTKSRPRTRGGNGRCIGPKCRIHMKGGCGRNCHGRH